MNEIKKPENPNAFPCDYKYDGNIAEQGMTLRDYFANSAMTSIVGAGITLHDDSKIIETYDYVAKNAYLIADAMLKQREQ